MVNTRKLKDEAAALIQKGRHAQALSLLEDVLKEEPEDHNTRRNIGDLLLKLGKRQDAIKAYIELANMFANEGFLLKAIATFKRVLELDPSHKEIQARLADLYSRREGGAQRSVKVMEDAPAARQAAVAIEVGDAGGGEMVIQGSGGATRAAPAAAGGPILLDAFTIEAVEIEPVVIPSPAPIAAEAPAAASAVPELVLATDLAPAAAEEPALELDTSRLPPPAVEPPPAPGPAPAAEEPALELDTSRLPPPVVEQAPARGPAGPILATDLAPAEPVPAAEPAPTPGPAEPAPIPEAARSIEIDVSSIAEPAPPTRLAEPAPADTAGTGSATELAEPAPAQRTAELPEIPLFSDLEPEAFIALVERMRMVPMNPGDWILREGEEGASMFAIASGKVRVLKRLEAKKMLQLAVLGEGQFFGEMSVLRGGPRGASVQAVEPGDLFEITRELLDAVRGQYPTVEDVLKRFAQQRMLRNVMATSPLFRPFGKDERVAIIERFVSRDVDAGAELVTEGLESDGLYLVLRGAMDVLCKGCDGQPISVGEIREGEVFGEISCLKKKPAIATVRAKGPGTVLRLPRQDFDSLVMSHPQILELVSQIGEERIVLTANALAQKGILV